MQNPDQPDSKKDFKAPNRDMMTNAQVNTLLQIAGCMHMVLSQPAETEFPKRPELDGGVKSSAEATLINVCSQLDDIVKDTDRWTTDTQNNLEKKLDDVYTGQIQVFKSQIAVNELMQTPHHRFRPSLFPTADGNYIAFIGDLSRLETSIYGRGHSPEAALAAFDEIFAGKLPDYMVQWMADREAAIESGKTPPAAPVKPKEAHADKMDGKRSGKTGAVAPRRKNSKTNRGDTPPDGEGGGSKTQPDRRS